MFPMNPPGVWCEWMGFGEELLVLGHSLRHSKLKPISWNVLKGIDRDWTRNWWSFISFKWWNQSKIIEVCPMRFVHTSISSKIHQYRVTIKISRTYTFEWHRSYPKPHLSNVDCFLQLGTDLLHLGQVRFDFCNDGILNWCTPGQVIMPMATR